MAANSNNCVNIIYVRLANNISKNPYDRLIGDQLVNCPIPVLMCGNIFSARPGNKCEANNHDPSYMSVFPKIIPPMVQRDIYVELVRVWLKIICNSYIINRLKLNCIIISYVHAFALSTV